MRKPIHHGKATRNPAGENFALTEILTLTGILALTEILTLTEILALTGILIRLRSCV